MNQAIDKMKENLWKLTAPTSETGASKEKDDQAPEHNKQQKAKGKQPHQQQSRQSQRQQNDKAQPLKVRATKLQTKNKEQQQKQPEVSKNEFLVQPTAVNLIRHELFNTPLPTSDSQKQDEKIQPAFQQTGPPPIHLQQTAVSKVRRQIFRLPPTANNMTLVDDSIPDPSPGQQKDQSERRQRHLHLKKPKQNQERQKRSTKGTTANDEAVGNENNDDKAKGGEEGQGKKDGDKKEGEELEKMKGIFWCGTCQRRWKSLNVFCIKGTKQVQYGQICDGCKTVLFPARVQKIKCITCGAAECDCKVKKEPLLEPKMAHRKDLCVKCLSGNPCA